jgi:hypothetical protein
MSLNIKSMSAAGAAVLLVLAATGAIAQQNPPRSTKRIPISKEAGGEVVRVDTLMRVDTVTNTIYRTDTLTRTMTRIDTVVVKPPAPPIRLPAGFYAGIAAGTSSPDGSIFIPNSTGFLGQAHIGWGNARQFLGGRISGTYTDLGQDSQFSQGTSAQLWTMSTDLKLNVPLGRAFGLTPRLNAYGIGGWTYTWFRNLPHRLDDVTINNNDLNIDDTRISTFRLGEDSWTGRNGWDAGGGLSLLWGRSEVFVEARVMGFSPRNSPSARQVPVVLGFNWY